MDLRIIEAELQDAQTVEFAYELMDIVGNCKAQGLDEWGSHLYLLICIATKLTGRNCATIPDAELTRFIAANRSDFEIVLTHFHEVIAEVYDLAEALYIADHATVGEA